MELQPPYNNIPSVFHLILKTLGETLFFGAFYILS